MAYSLEVVLVLEFLGSMYIDMFIPLACSEKNNINSHVLSSWIGNDTVLVFLTVIKPAL